jgi:hypothetical protein
MLQAKALLCVTHIEGRKTVNKVQQQRQTLSSSSLEVKTSWNSGLC